VRRRRRRRRRGSLSSLIPFLSPPARGGKLLRLV